MDMIKKGPEYVRNSGGYVKGDEYFYATENAHVVRDAERYYRNSLMGGSTTWNLRDTHMAETLGHIINYFERKTGEEGKAIIWAHNSHVGDTRATMYGREGEHNIGQLIRQQYGEKNAFTVGFTTYEGTVMAAKRWGAKGEVMTLNKAEQDTYEYVFHQALPNQDFTLVLRNADKNVPTDKNLVDELSVPRYERMIGVQYVKDRERSSHYIRCNLPRQFDAVIHIDRSEALSPLPQVD